MDCRVFQSPRRLHHKLPCVSERQKRNGGDNEVKIPMNDVSNKGEDDKDTVEM